MSESAEQSFDAPPSRIAKAKREGNVPRAQEFGANLSFATAAGAAGDQNLRLSETYTKRPSEL